MSGGPRCVWCRERPEADEFRPFCSKRCKMADLSQWLDGRYRVEGAMSGAADESEAPGADDEPHGSSRSTE
jgi:uncharacterized protein